MRRPSPIACAMVARLSSTSTRSAACRATSVPPPMATPMSAQRRRVVHPVAGHRHDLPLLLEGGHDFELPVRLGACVHPDVLELVRGEGTVLAESDVVLLRAENAETSADRGGGGRVVPGDQQQAYAAALEAGHRLGGGLPQRVTDAEEA